MPDFNYYDINLTQLVYFISAAEHLNFSKAAEECHVVPNVISKQISNIQSKLGTVLFYKDKKKMYLTEAGKVLYKYAVNTVSRVSDSVEAAQEYDPSINMELKIGYFDIWAQSFIPPVVRDFKSIYPNAAVTIKYFNRTQLVPRMNSGVIDLVFIAPFRRSQNPDIEHLLLDQSPVDLVVSENHSLSSRDEVDLDQFYRMSKEYFPSFNFTPTDSQDPVDIADMAENFLNNVKVFSLLGLEEAQNAHNILFSLRAENGVGFLPDAARSRYTDELGIKFIRINGNIAPINMYMTWKKNSANPAIQPFVEVAKKHISPKVLK